MQISILNVSILTKPAKTGKSYQVADVAYKNLTFQGKIEGKQVMSFGVTAESFKTLSTAQPGDTFEVEVVKNAAGYNDWVGMSKSDGVVPSVPVGSKPMATAQPTKSNYETAEERAKRQVLIVRQSSLSSAVNTLAVGSKKLEPADVLAVAKIYEDYVFGKAAQGDSGFEDFPAGFPDVE